MYALQMLYCTRIDMYAFNFEHLSYLKVLKNTSLSLAMTSLVVQNATIKNFCKALDHSVSLTLNDKAGNSQKKAKYALTLSNAKAGE